MRYIFSSDRGAHFSGERQLGDASDLRFSAFVEDPNGDVFGFYGDYCGVAVSQAFACPVWCRSFPEPASPAAQHQTAWVAPIVLDSVSYCFLTGPTLRVGPSSPYHTVRSAYNAVSQDCTTIVIETGTYHEIPLPFTLSKRVRLESQDGPAIIGP